METLQQLISRQINKVFAVGASFCVVILVGYSLVSIRQLSRQAELLIMSQASSLTQSASLSQDLYSVQKEISRFVDSLNQTQPYSTRIEVRMDDRLIGSAGDYPRFQLFSSKVSKVFSLNSGKSFEFVGLIDYSRSLLTSILAVLATLAVFGSLVGLLNRKIHRSLLHITGPLECLVSEIERISQSLPDALESPFSLPLGSTREVITLHSAVHAFVSEIGGLHATLSLAHSQKARFEIATQVAHDIRSPLAALAAAERDLAILPEDTRILIRGAVGRIRDIANELLSKNDPTLEINRSDTSSSEEAGPQLLSSHIEAIITEKRMQYRARLGIEIEFSLEPNSYGIFASIQAKEFKRVLSNLINNAVEAMPTSGKVEVFLGSTPAGVCVSVTDNGQGIPKNILSKLTQRGETHGKTGGSGLGLFHARKSCEAWNGTLDIESVAGQGTVVTLTLPHCSSPGWFTDRLLLHPDMSIVVLDDDPSIHRIWQGRWETLRLQERSIHLEHISTPDQLREWHSQQYQKTTQVLFLVDYELLGFDESGLDLIQDLHLCSQSVLVTSRFEENSIRERCLKLGVKLLPKGMAGFVPVELLQPKDQPDLILVDDDPLIHMVWKLNAQQCGLKLRGFNSAENFLAAIESIDENTPTYIDENLGAGQSGLTIARGLHERGFKRLFLATGYQPERFRDHPWLAGVVGKEPPTRVT